MLKLRAETRVVQIDVTVRDSKGKPVQDLKQSDFTVTDNGKPRSFTIFSANNLDDASHTKTDLTDGKPPRAKPELPPNTFTNTNSSPPPEGAVRQSFCWMASAPVSTLPCGHVRA